MGFTHKELINGLSSAVAPYSVFKVNETQFEILMENRVAKLTMSDEKTRSIASLKLPVISVKIEFENFTQNQYNSFVERFKKYLHRGGG